MLPAVGPLCPIAHAQLFGGGGDAEKIVVKAQNALKLGGRLAAAGQFADAMRAYQSAAAELQAARDANDKVSSERSGQDDGPTGEEIADLLAKRIAELKDLVGGGTMSAEEVVHDVWEQYENVRRDFGDGDNASPADWEELARFLRVGSARVEGAFARQGALRTSVIPNQGRVETRGAAMLADLKNAFAQADKQAQKSRPKNLSASTPIAAGAEPSVMQRSRMRDLLTQAPKPGEFLAGAGTEAMRAKSLEETAKEVEALLAAYPALKDELIQKPMGGDSSIKGSQLPGLYRAGIKELGQQVVRVEGEAAQQKVDTATAMIEVETGNMDEVMHALSNNGFIRWGAAESLSKPGYLAQRRASWQKQYQDMTGKPMPAAFFKPLETKLAAARAAVDKKAPTWSWPSGSHNAAMEAKAKAFVQSFYKARVLKTAMAEEGWRIQKNDIDIPTLRARSVRVLAQFPGEKWARHFNVAYVQDYAGGGSYNSGATISEPIDFRWMKAQ